jgi:hypothetical protein
MHIPALEIHTNLTVFHFSTHAHARSQQYSNLQLMINLALSKKHYVNENNFQCLHLVESHKLVSQWNWEQALNIT